MITKKDIQKVLSNAGWLTYLDASAFNALFSFVEDNAGGLELVQTVLGNLNHGKCRQMRP